MNRQQLFYFLNVCSAMKTDYPSLWEQYKRLQLTKETIKYLDDMAWFLGMRFNEIGNRE